MATCCGSERDTAFCPNCGSRLAGDAKAGLLAHLRKRVATENTKVRKAEERIDEGQPDQEVRQRRIEAVNAYKRDAAKWQSWLDWVLEHGE